MAERRISPVMLVVTVVIVAAVVGAAVWYSVQMSIPVTPPPKKELKIAVLLPSTITDAGWNAGMYLAATNETLIEMLEKYTGMDVTMTVAEGLGQVGIEGIVEDFIAKGYKIIIGHTIGYVDTFNEIAPKYPDVQFIYSSGWSMPKNVATYWVPLWEPAFLAGMAAADITKTRKIGCVAGFAYGTTIAVCEGFFEGAEYWKNKTGGAPIQYRAIYPGFWDNIDKGREAGTTLTEWGADVINSRGNGLTLGVIQAVSYANKTSREKGIPTALGRNSVYMVGDVADQYLLASDVMLTSKEWHLDVVLWKLVTMWYDKKLENKEYTWGIAGGEMALSPFRQFEKLLSKEVKKEIADLIARAKAGTFKFPFITKQRY